MENRPYIYDEEANLITMRDPMVLVDGDTYWLTGTQPPYWSGINDGVHLWSSKDLKKWKDEGLILKRADLPEEFWGRDRFWAPELFKTKEGKYLLTFNCRNDSEAYHHGHAVGLAVADAATGPYTILSVREPISASIGDGANDGTIFCDDDGQLYLGFTSAKKLYLSKLDAENGTISDSEVVCEVGAEGEWDSIGVEGQCIVKRHGIYYHWYSSWTTGYAAGVLTSRSIHGPWVKSPQNPVISTSETWDRAGHNHSFRTPDGKEYISFHANMKDPADGNLERIFFKPVEYTADGQVIVGE